MLPKAIEHFVQNEKVCRKIQAAVGEYDELTLGKKWKLRWFGHVSRSSGVVKTILQDTVKGEKDADRRRSGKTISKSGQEWTFPAQLRQL